MVNALDNGNQYRAVFTNSAGSVSTKAATLTVPPESIPSQSGYFEFAEPSDADFTQVSATWTAPTVACPPGANTWSVQWPGIGYGVSLVQDGTGASCHAGVPTYAAFYELVGDADVNGGDELDLDRLRYPVSPGDAVTGSVSIANSIWTLSLADATKPWVFTFSTPGVPPTPNVTPPLPPDTGLAATSAARDVPPLTR